MIKDQFLYTLYFNAEPGTVIKHKPVIVKSQQRAKHKSMKQSNYSRYKHFVVPATGKVIMYVGASTDPAQRLKKHKIFASYTRKSPDNKKPYPVYELLKQNNIDIADLKMDIVTNLGNKYSCRETNDDERELIGHFIKIGYPIQNVHGRILNK